MIKSPGNKLAYYRDNSISPNSDTLLNIQKLETHLKVSGLAPLSKTLCSTVTEVIDGINHGDKPRWEAALAALPGAEGWDCLLNQGTVTVGTNSSLTRKERNQLEITLETFIPWRKGPFSIAGVQIDTEWRSDWKWTRLVKHLKPLHGRRLLDVGCGNGYHLWRFKSAGAATVIGIDPTLLYLYQFNVLNHFIKANNTFLLPLRSDQLPAEMECFDTVVSMGVLYHRRTPEQHLQELMDALRPGGELVLETLISPPDEAISLGKGDRYARMRNVWTMPTSNALIAMLQSMGLEKVRLVEDDITTVDEQRTTRWMPFESLSEALDPEDSQKTIEGWPAPRRAILIASKAK